MANVIVNQKPNGQHLRVTVEHKPVQIPELVQLQQRIQSSLSEFTPKDSKYMHVTLLHLGIPQDIYFEFRRYNSNLVFEDFMEGFLQFLQALHQFIEKKPA